MQSMFIPALIIAVLLKQLSCMPCSMLVIKPVAE